MRKLTLDEKINIKAELAKKNVLKPVLVQLDMRSALSLFWRCFGRPLSTYSNPSAWRKPIARRSTSLQRV